MFWRRSRAKEAAEETNDLAKLQKKFGITPVSDADVQKEFQALLSATGATGGSSPTEESLLFGAGGDEDEDEEAKILRDLNLNGLSLDDDDDGSDDHQQAENELRGVLDDVHHTARESHRREVAEMSGKASVQVSGGIGGAMITPDRAAQVHALKTEAVALKREGKIQEALDKFREAKQLQERVSSAQGSVANASRDFASKTPHEGSHRSLLETIPDDRDQDVEVTDEDMQDPEFIAQLAKMGLAEDDKDVSGGAEAARYHDVMLRLSALETQIHECKVQAVDLKRQNQIAEALTCMRKIKELEAMRDELRSSPAASDQVPVIQRSAASSVTESVYHLVAARTPASERMNSAAMPLSETQNDSDNDSILDVEVTAEDTSDSAFAAELLKLNGDDTTSVEPAPPNTVVVARSIVAVSSYAAHKPTPPSSRSLKSAPSIDEDYLIDAFDHKSDSDGESNHLTTVMSSGSLHSASFVPDIVKAAAPLEAVSAAENNHIAGLIAQLQKVRQTGLALKRKGDIQGALESMRRAKQIQSLIDLTQQTSGNPATTVGSEQNPAIVAKFQEIEQMLVKFGNQAMALAKENLSGNREKASEWLAKRKRYGAELEKLRQMRQNPLQTPPLYEIVKTSLKVEHKLPFIADNQIKVSVKSVTGLSQVAGRSVFVKFCLNFPSATPHEGQTGEFQINSSAPFATELPLSHIGFVFNLSRSRGTMRLFEIKKAVFEVWKPGTLFRNPELVARTYQELSPLLSYCEINTHLPFVGSNRKPCGGDIEIAIQMLRPLKEKEFRLEIVEDLVIHDYPAPLTSSAEHIPMPSVVLEPPPADTLNPTNKILARISDGSNAIANEDQQGYITPALDDPHSVDLIVSYDVINEELEKVGAKLPSLTGPTAIEWSDRYDSLALKKQLLEIEMQTGNLTLDMYVERLHKRIAEDRVLISKLLSSNRRLDAARVLHRIKIMEKELVGANGDSAES